MLDFFFQYISTYDITTEVVIIMLAIIMLVIFSISKPKRTHMMNMVIVGVVMAIITMVLHIAMLGETLHINEGRSKTVFYIIYCLHSLAYVTVICDIYLYISRLTLKRRLNLKITIYNTIVLAVVSHIVLAYPLITNKLFHLEDGVYKLTNYFNCNVYCSILCAVMAFCTIIYNRNSVSRVVYIGTVALTPLVALGAVAQIYIPTAYFLCATYILPFLIVYILFHAYRFDEITGSQYYEAQSYMLQKMLARKKGFLFLKVHYPRLENLDYEEIRNGLLISSNAVCRQIDRVHNGIRVYRISNYRYHIICPINSEADYEKTVDSLLRIFDEQDKDIFKTAKHILISRKFDGIQDAEQYIFFMNHMERYFTNPDQSEIRYVTDEDCERYTKGAVVEANLMDIRMKNQLDDERILVFVQPIYSIAEGKFRTGEALMRMKIDGKMVFPDEFIPVAESTECIHTLTKIMLYKVAKKTVELAKNYPDFEALTVNVSTFEMDDPDVGQEFLDIIAKAGANPSNVRMEITESTTITDYSRIIENMKFLVANGIRFYLDDFGTGYSNLERITKFPFQTIKFDKSLLYRALEDKGSEELFVLLLNYFKSNGFYTVIEGVEDEAQKKYVEETGFAYIQGYYFSKPLPENEVDRFFLNAQ